ncbi:MULTISPECIES: hypothetical protein [Halocynthiibacter]|uniref:HPt domain-containing protein n=1 Tax=Halocynthiibacter halioticoli TaxID=2986804 RepID=A0AAE3J4L3_9RHOB|nr:MULTISPECIES: hypothetical protein [Halocynthiibacter]MCV6825857.1 hypothetical protein [Halocynthiibacter halioticoli]MCW4058858.1 hypothetical protein [Halocynthiibacter sp. SDUM655004]MDE0588369.1 hypothetical protein [Halocynthiibacter sp. C4]
METVDIRPDEDVRLNPERLTELFNQLGNRGAADVVCRAMEELAARLTKIEKSFWQGEYQAVSKGARSLIAIAEQIGLNGLAQVARHVSVTARTEDKTATAATVARLLRMGDRSLSAVWNTQNLSG